MKFPKAAKVKINQAPDHEYHNLLASSFNQKILSGLGDCAWRIFYYAYSMFRGVRNPQDNNYPAQDEWFKFYGYLEPKSIYGKFGWPESFAGEAAGANVANPFMAWIFGNNTRTRKADGTPDDTRDRIFGYWSEPIRLGGLELQAPSKMPRDIRGSPELNLVWSDSQIQRGCAAFEPNFRYLARNSSSTSTKELSLVSLGICAAARRHLRYVMETASMGRYAPSYVPDQNMKGGVFRKKNAVKDQIEQAIFYYLGYFRGTEDKRAKHNLTGKDVREDGFDFETFFSRQFLLAPNYSKPKYELNPDGSIKIDSLGNKKIKYDNFGYPELFPEGPLSFAVSIPAPSTSSSVVVNGFDGSFKDSTANSQFDTNPDPATNKNRFCLSAIFIQTSDVVCGAYENPDLLLQGAYIDVYVNSGSGPKIYQSIPIEKRDRYAIRNRTNVVTSVNQGQTNQYQVYQFNKIHYFRYPVKGKVSFVLRGTQGVAFPIAGSRGGINVGIAPQNGNSAVSFFIKFAHVLEMKPSAADAYVVLRVATTEGQGADAGQMDPVGHFNTDAAKKVYNNYIKYGVAYTLSTGKTLYQNDAYVSANPVYESARKFITRNIKMADRVSLVDYQVDSENRSVLYFKRFAYGMKNTGVDIFRGMGPSIDEVGNRNMRGTSIEEFTPIVKGKKYIVIDRLKSSENTISYVDGSTVKKLKHGSVFTGGDYYYVSSYSSPDIGVYELDGITGPEFINEEKKAEIYVNGKKQVSPGTVTNEWCMFMSYNLYHWSNSSAWKPEMYGDIMGALNARCLTSSKALEYYSRTSKNVKKHLAQVTWRPNTIPLVVEAPSGYNFIESANINPQYGAWKQDINIPSYFAQSCMIYKPPYQIRSVERLNALDPKSEIIKVTLQNRLQTTQGNETNQYRVSENMDRASQTFTSNVSTNRTDENAVVDYVLHILTGKSCPRGIIGDVSLDNQNFWQKHAPFGCCYPRFYFVRMIPYVSAFTPMYSDHYRQMEFYLRAMCNGFINRASTMTPEEVQSVISEGLSGINMVGGYDSAIGDYIFEDLMALSYDNPEVIPISPNMVGRG